jgi:hypothetical protein
MDPITEQILLEAKIIDSIKKIAPTVQNAIMKGNVSVIRSIADKLPQKDLGYVEKEAIKKLPGFREKYKEFQRMMIRNPYAKNIENPAALVGAIAASLSDHITPDIVNMKLSEAAKNAQKLIFFPGDTKLLKLILFIVAILLIYVTKGAIILPALQYLFTGMSLLMALLGKLLSGAATVIEVGREQGPEAITHMKAAMDQILTTHPPGTAGLF